MTRVIVAGGTGLVGGHLLEALSRRPDVETIALVRRAGAIAPLPGVTEQPFDFDDPASYERLGPCDAVFCCLGTTIAKAGSQAAFLKVDRDLPAAFVRRLATLSPRPRFGLVSSVGASESGNFYLRTKAEVERLVIESGMPYAIVRPSLLLGARKELRPLERLGAALFGPLTHLAEAAGGRRVAVLGKYLPVEARGVAEALLRLTLDSQAPSRIVEGWELHPGGVSASGSP